MKKPDTPRSIRLFCVVLSGGWAGPVAGGGAVLPRAEPALYQTIGSFPWLTR